MNTYQGIESGAGMLKQVYPSKKKPNAMLDALRKKRDALKSV